MAITQDKLVHKSSSLIQKTHALPSHSNTFVLIQKLNLPLRCHATRMSRNLFVLFVWLPRTTYSYILFMFIKLHVEIFVDAVHFIFFVTATNCSAS